jgi:hypothetical protein
MTRASKNIGLLKMWPQAAQMFISKDFNQIQKELGIDRAHFERA